MLISDITCTLVKKAIWQVIPLKREILCLLGRSGTKQWKTIESAIMMVILVMSIMVLYQKKAKAFFSVLVETLFELVRNGFKTKNWQLFAM
jgi:hypothetical protein